MKAYKRQKIAIFTLLAGVGMAGSVFAADISSIHVNDMVHKPVVTKMHKESTSTTGMTTNKKHVKKTHKKTDPTSMSTTVLDNHKDGEKKEIRGGAPNSDQIKRVNTTVTSHSTSTRN